MSKRPKSQRRAFPLAFLSSALVQVLLALVERRIGKNKTARTWTSRLKDRGIVPIPEGLVFCAHLCINIKWEVEVGCVTTGGNLGGGCERREPFAVTPSIAPLPTIEIAMLDIVFWR